MHRQRILTVIKLLIGITLIVFLFLRVNTAELFSQLATAKIKFLILVLILPHVGIFLSTVKWKILLKNIGIKASTRRLFFLYLIGTFFNNFLPTMVGGDLVRSYSLGQETKDYSAVIAGTFMERFLGFAALISLLPLILAQHQIVARFPNIKYFVISVIVFFGIVVLLIFKKTTIFLMLEKKVGRILGHVFEQMDKIRQKVFKFKKYKRSLVISFFISIVFYLVTSCSTWAAAQSIGANVKFFYLLAILPTVLLAATIPISLNGFGITEAGYVFFLGLAGVENVDALAMALILRARLLLSALIGGLCYLIYKPKMAKYQAAIKIVGGRSKIEN